MPLLPVAHSTLGSVIGAGMLLASCGGSDGTPDAGPCWPLNAKPGGQVELGTGDIDFVPMPAMLAIVSSASQSDPFLQVHARIRGMPPGNPDDFFDPRNPKTKVAAVIEDPALTLGVECPASIGYVSSPEAGAFDMLHSLRLGFGLFPLEQVSGKQARITIEVVGSNGLYARDEKLVTLTTPSATPAALGGTP
jgi:hypothetical protein